jgi:iron complex outermembrane receptor protein
VVAALTDDLKATLSWDHSVDRSNPFYVLNDGPVRSDLPTFNQVNHLTQFSWDQRGPFSSDIAATNNSHRDLVALRLDAQLGSTAHLTSITGYSQRDIRYMADFDGTAVPVVTFDPATQFHPSVWQASQEVTLTADLTDRLDLILGSLYLYGRNNQNDHLGLPYFGIPSYKLLQDTSDRISSWAGYTQWRYRLTDTLRLTAGIRYTHDDVTHVDGGGVGSLAAIPSVDRAPYSAWTPRFALDYMPGRDTTLYASVARGYKAGGFNAPATPFKPEFVWNYEVGLKKNWLDRRLNSRLAAFRMKYNHLQQTIQDVDPTRGVIQRIVSANATIEGMELELDAALTQRFHVTTAGTWLPTAHYDDLQSVDTQFPELGVRNLSGNRMIQSPKYQYNVTGEYTQPLPAGWEAAYTVSYSSQGQKYFDVYNHPLLQQGAYGLLNLSASIQTQARDWQLTAFANNVTDQLYRTDKIAVNTDYTTAWIGLPRMYGVSLSHHF